MGLNYGRLFSRKQTPQNEPIPAGLPRRICEASPRTAGREQAKNSGGGFAWAVDEWVRLDRFLILGS